MPWTHLHNWLPVYCHVFMFTSHTLIKFGMSIATECLGSSTEGGRSHRMFWSGFQRIFRHAVVRRKVSSLSFSCACEELAGSGSRIVAMLLNSAYQCGWWVMQGPKKWDFKRMQIRVICKIKYIRAIWYGPAKSLCIIVKCIKIIKKPCLHGERSPNTSRCHPSLPSTEGFAPAQPAPLWFRAKAYKFCVLQQSWVQTTFGVRRMFHLVNVQGWVLEGVGPCWRPGIHPWWGKGSIGSFQFSSKYWHQLFWDPRLWCHRFQGIPCPHRWVMATHNHCCGDWKCCCLQDRQQVQGTQRVIPWEWLACRPIWALGGQGSGSWAPVPHLCLQAHNSASQSHQGVCQCTGMAGDGGGWALLTQYS